MSNSGIVSRLKKKKITEVVAAEKRMDGRGLEDYREITLNVDFLEKAEGSADVTLGNTRVIAGVKVDLGSPFDDTPNKGVLMVNSEFSPIAHPSFEPGPPGEESIELARVVDRGLRSAELIEFDKLCLIPGKKVYMVFIDLHVINYDGNLIDCSAMAALAALKKAKLPGYKVENDVCIPTGKSKTLKLVKEPLSVTMAKIGGKIIVDPTADEEEVLDVRLTVTLDEKNNICTLQKTGSEGLTLEEIQKAIYIAKEKAAENRAKL